MNFLDYTFETSEYGKADNIPSNCSGILFLNQGTLIAYVDGFPINPNGGSFSPDTNDSSNVNSIQRCKKVWKLTFQAGAGTKDFRVIRKVYEGISYS